MTEEREETADVDRIMQMQGGLRCIDIRNTFTNPLGDLIFKANKALELVKEELIKIEGNQAKRAKRVSSHSDTINASP